MNKIKILPVHLVNKIAAGECIERPASVIKELAENSLDAGASRIDVFVEQGGMKQIRVVDNGSGIDAADLPLAVTPHATSKLRDENDLYAIGTMGFRGEALTSIGAVSILKIASIVGDQASGGAIEVQGDRIGEVRPYAGSAGTTVEIHNLFFNTPARRKFLKSVPTELGHCQEALVRLALAYPNVSFSLHHGNRVLLQLSATDDPRARIGDLFGPEIGDGLIQVFSQTNDLTFAAYVSRPELAKPSANFQYFFVNRRAVRDRYLSHALREAYRGLIAADRQPVGFLFLDVDPTIVDVNVHPTKSEVRFADSGRIHSLVLGSLRERFLSTDLTADLRVGSPGEGGSGLESEKSSSPTRQRVQEALTDFLKSASRGSQARISFAPGQSRAAAPASRGDEPEVSRGADSIRPPRAPAARVEAPSASPPEAPPPAGAAPRVLQIHNAYLVVETADGLMIVDQHALHERILYQDLRARVNDGQVPRQKLLVPELVNVAPEQMEQVERIRASLDRAGVEVEAFGPQTVAIHSLPAMVGHLSAASFVEELLDRVGRMSDVEAEQVLEQVLQSLACQGAVKAGDPLRPEEIQTLLTLREGVDLSCACPHGRPTVLQMSLADLRKQFKRT